MTIAQSTVPRNLGDIAVQLNTRVRLSSRQLIERTSQRTGMTIREVIENAVLAQYGDEGAAEQQVTRG